MDPITVTIVSALAAGAAAAAKDVATDAIKDAYAGLKQLIVDRYRKTSEAVDLVTAAPASRARQAVLAEELEETDAIQDAELKAAAQKLLDAVDELRTKPGIDALFNFENLRVARDFQLEDIETAGPVVRAADTDIGRDLKFKGVHQKPAGSNRQKH
jgi:hypothetical protein